MFCIRGLKLGSDLGMKVFWGRMTATKIIVFGYLSIILCGTLLLCLPIASQARTATPFLDALFTATSATCVTGLVVFDTATYWSAFGHVVLLALIQIGGLGFITMAIMVSVFSGRRIGLKSRFLMQESIAAPQMGGIVRLTRFVFAVTLIVESVGAVLLATRFVPIFGAPKGVWYGIFHTVSAFCNAGFDLMGAYSGKFSSLTAFAHDPVVNLTIMALIIFGGLGFFVWENLWLHRRDKKHLSLQTKIVLLATAVLIFVPAALIFVFQNKQLGDGTLGRGAQALAALFQSVTTRTAGFNSVNLDSLTPNSQLLMVLLMLIGGSPGSTAGGVKTTTVVVLLLCVRASLRREDELECFGRRIDRNVLKNAVTIATSYLVLTVAGAMALSHLDGVSLMEAMFETSSAIATVGLTLGITPALGTLSHLILIFLMFFGRVGCLTLLYAIVENQLHSLSRMPLEKIAVG